MNHLTDIHSGKFYFPNFTGLRFYLFLTIIYRHIEEMKFVRHIQQTPETIIKFHSIGHYALMIFFTISGFLITYQLEIQRKKTSTIDIKKFYKNRALRILPLFYLSIVLHWFIMPNSFIADYYNSFFFKPILSTAPALYDIPKDVYFYLSISLLPHLAFVIANHVNHAWIYGVQHWSVGVEEVFYIFWPILLLKMKRFKTFILKGFVIYYVIFFFSVLFQLISWKVFHNNILNSISVIISTFIACSSYTCFFIGAIGIYVYMYRADLIEKYVSKSVALFCFVVILINMFSSIELPIFLNEIVTGCSMVCLLYLLKTKKSYYLLENKFVVYLGKITYSAYLVHFVCIIITLYFMEMTGLQHRNLFWFNVLLYSGSMILTFVSSAILYEYVEKKFLAMR